MSLDSEERSRKAWNRSEMKAKVSAIGQNPALVATLEKHPNVTIISFWDDHTIMGLPEDVLNAFKTLQEEKERRMERRG